jgi:hypothetical protein
MKDKIRTITVGARPVEVKPRSVPRDVHVGRTAAAIMLTVYDMADAAKLTYGELTVILADEVSRRVALYDHLKQIDRFKPRVKKP